MVSGTHTLLVTVRGTRRRGPRADADHGTSQERSYLSLSGLT